MKKSQKWSEQCLIEDTFGHKDESGNVVEKTSNCLKVCISGRELFKKSFMDGEYKGKNKLDVPFDFIVVAGDMCPKGRFYEVEYTIGDYGLVYRALIQAVDPVTDLQLIIGVLKQKNIIPNNVKADKAWLREDIDAVCIGSCFKDEDGEISFLGGYKKASDGTMDDGERLSVLDYAIKYKLTGCNFDYYHGDVREVWVPEKCDCKDKIFVCGVNGNDPDFAVQRETELSDMWYHLDEAAQIAKDYGLSFFSLWQKDNENYSVNCNNMTFDVLKKTIEAMKNA